MDLISDDVLEPGPPIRGGARGLHIEFGAIARTGRLAALCFGLVVAILAALRPPVILATDDDGAEGIAWARVAGVAAVAAAATVGLLHR
jgi:hypothetical protein